MAIGCFGRLLREIQAVFEKKIEKNIFWLSKLILRVILENRLYCFFIDEKLKNISTYFLYKEFFSRINAILMFSPIDTRIIDENVDTAYRNSINNSQLLMKMSILRIEICINNLCIDGIKHQYCVIIKSYSGLYGKL